jgi:hypothetical protein
LIYLFWLVGITLRSGWKIREAASKPDPGWKKDLDIAGKAFGVILFSVSFGTSVHVSLRERVSCIVGKDILLSDFDVCATVFMQSSSSDAHVMRNVRSYAQHIEVTITSTATAYRTTDASFAIRGTQAVGHSASFPGPDQP